MLHKNKKYLILALCALMVASLLSMLCMAGCTSTEQDNTANTTTGQASTRDVTDMIGRKVTVPVNVNRIVGIGPSSLRAISYLQATDKVVGIEAREADDAVMCCYTHVYHDTFKDLPVIGEGGSKGTTSNEEALVQVAPEVIFANIDKDSADALQEKTGIPVICLTLSNLIFDQTLYDNLSLMGNIIGAQDRANDIIAYMHDIQNDLKARTANLSKSEIKTAYAAGISFRGGHGFAGTEANFPPFNETNVINIADESGAKGAFDIDLETISTAQPDYIFVEGNNLNLVKDDYAANPSYFNSLEAVKEGRVNTLISYRYYAANIELALANCYQVGSVVYPERFKDIDPTKKLDEITEFFLGKKLSSDLSREGYRFTAIDLARL